MELQQARKARILKEAEKGYSWEVERAVEGLPDYKAKVEKNIAQLKDLPGASSQSFVLVVSVPAVDTDCNYLVAYLVHDNLDSQSTLSCRMDIVVEVRGRSKLIVDGHKTPDEVPQYRSSQLHPMNWEDWTLMKGKRCQPFSEEEDCIRQCCVDYRYLTSVPRAYGHSNVRQ